MGKIIVWIVIFFLVLLALRLLSVHKTRNERREHDDHNGRDKSEDPRRKRDDKPATDAMVKCERCGVFLPKANALMTRDGWTCGDSGCAQKR